VATIGYSLVGKSEDVRMKHLNQDVKDALRFLAQNSDRFGIDRHTFIILGQSAGGSLALIASLTPPDHLPGAVSGPGADYKVIGCINFFGATTFLEPSVVAQREVNQGRQNSWFALEEGLDSDQTVIDCSPDKHLKGDSPPILMFSGEQDHKVPAAHGRHLKKLAEEVGANVTLYEIRNAGHGIKSADGGKLSMNRREFVKITLENIAKWAGD
jgi:acetyl esterase/lipase